MYNTKGDFSLVSIIREQNYFHYPCEVSKIQGLRLSSASSMFLACS